MNALIHTLADCKLFSARCGSCAIALRSSSPAESYSTRASLWVVVLCNHCNRWTPFQLERTQ